MGIPVKLEVFEGPLDLLLHLIDKNKLNIYDIHISTITDQYLAYIHLMEENQMDVMSEFIEMAATLIHIKSKMLLPVDEEETEDEGDPRLELVQKLIEYRKFKLISEQLRELQEDAGKICVKETTIPKEISEYVELPDPNVLLQDIDFSILYTIYQSVIQRKVNQTDPIRSTFGEIKPQEYSIEEKTAYIQSIGRKYSTFSFRDLLQSQQSRGEVVVTFLAILELMKIGEIVITQEAIFNDIIIKYLGREENGNE
jgi:segregation and condensation protein A